MEIISFFVGLLIASLICVPIHRKLMANKVWEVEYALRETKLNYSSVLGYFLETTKREVANEIMRRDKNRMRQEYVSVLAMYASYPNLSEDQKKEKLSRLTGKYPYIQDFNINGSLHFVPYEESLDHDLDTLCENYRDICEMLLVDEDIYEVRPNEQELNTLDNCISVQRDKEIGKLVQEGIHRAAVFGLWDPDSDNYRTEFEDSGFRIRCLHSSGPTSDTGIYLKSEKTYLKLEVFFHDMPSRKPSSELYYSDESFTEINDCVYRFKNPMYEDPEQ